MAETRGSIFVTGFRTRRANAVSLSRLRAGLQGGPELVSKETVKRAVVFGLPLCRRIANPGNLPLSSFSGFSLLYSWAEAVG